MPKWSSSLSPRRRAAGPGSVTPLGCKDSSMFCSSTPSVVVKITVLLGKPQQRLSVSVSSPTFASFDTFSTKPLGTSALIRWANLPVSAGDALILTPISGALPMSMLRFFSGPGINTQEQSSEKQKPLPAIWKNLPSRSSLQAAGCSAVNAAPRRAGSTRSLSSATLLLVETNCVSFSALLACSFFCKRARFWTHSSTASQEGEWTAPSLCSHSKQQI
mmetsp:Transcript_77094/g.136026  ORF Transcript_77094/g.136026 Transcript_77094/m.136026 type:complete len:218 (+) Transcript_77094:991-1644(+)